MTAQAEHTAPVDVLTAEDDPLIRRSLRGLLERQGYTCIEAEDGLRAVELALSAPPKCVLLDLVMPGLDGLAVARRLRADPRTSTAHIHCLTGLSDPAAREQARQAGCEAFLTKPVAPEVLLGVIRPSAGPAAPAPGSAAVPEQTRQAGSPAVSGAPSGAASAAGWVTGLTMTEAQELLDWLENQGCTRLEVSCPEGTDFAVRCACPPGFRLGRDVDGRVRLLKV